MKGAYLIAGVARLGACLAGWALAWGQSGPVGGAADPAIHEVPPQTPAMEVVADADPQPQPTTAEHIDFCRLLGNQGGLALR